ncbi:hypothetical protein [Candidatus Poriferisodalis sp.]|uniref:hypothetical protein n=1 Tax=Candidatus Poriferisodalis sp. TaxID=3101277 RepID=UPI003B01664F
MTAEDRLRGRLRSTASSMSVGSGSLAGVQARAAQLQRRRNAARGGVGAFALVAVAAIGVVSLRDGGLDELSDSVVAAEQQQEAVPVSATTAAVAVSVAQEESAEEAMADEEMADEAAAEILTTAAASDDESSQVVPEQSEEAAAGPAKPSVGETLEPAIAGESENWDSKPPASSDPESAVFATTVSIVQPPSDAEGADMRYSFSGAHAVARAAGNWYAYDGADWQTVGLPGDMEVVAVDLSGSGRIAVFGVVRPLECGREQVVAVRTGEKWSYVRVDDDTPPTVGWELLEARVRVTDAAIELERVERLWLDEQCPSPTEYEAPIGAAAELVADLEEIGEMRRDSWPHARLDGGFADRWPHVARSDAHAAAASGADLEWTTMSPPKYTVPALPLTPSRSADGGAVAVALHETTVMDVATTVHVSHGMAMLKRGGQTWEVCPIADEELDQVNGEVGRAGEHLAVVVGKPEQTLFLVERTE